jgi:hypothetical protein
MRSRSAYVAATTVASVVGVCASVCLTIPALAGTASGADASTTPAWLQRVNDVRVAAGVGAVTETSSWTTGIQHHLTYLELTDPSLITGQYASWHTENPASAYYTTDGALEGSRSNLVRHASQTATSAIDYWLGAPFHAIGMLRAGLSRTAFAQDSLWAGMDVISGLSSGVHAATPVLFPGPGSTDYLTTYSGGESPDPIETCRKAKAGADYSAPGLPIIAMLPAAPATNLSATLTTPGGAALSSSGSEVCIVDENTYTSSDAVYGPSGQQILTNDHAVLIVPRTRLVAGTYAVRITQSKQADIAWSFVVDPTAAPGGSPPTTTPPEPLAPVVTTTQVRCSYGARASGSVDLTVSNPADGAGTAAYSLALGARTSTGSAADGADLALTVSGLPPGAAPGSVSGSDGTSAVFSVDVPTCPRYEGVRVHLRMVAHHHLRIDLDNTRNAVATRFRIEIGHDGTPRLVAAAASDRVRVRLHRATLVRVHVGDHLVARAWVRP